MNTIAKSSRWPLVITTTLCFAIGALLQYYQGQLKTTYSPKHTFSLQMASDATEADAIRHYWASTFCENACGQKTDEICLDVARKYYAVDTFLFIPLYTIVLFLLLKKWERPYRRKFIPYLSFLPLLFDVMENTMTWCYLDLSWKWSAWTPVLTVFKFLAMAVCIAFMRNFLAALSAYAKKIFSVLWRFRIIVLSILVLYLALWLADQGQDLLVSLNTTVSGVVIFYGAITIMALLHWHMPKYLSTRTDLNRGEVVTLWQWIKMIFSGSVAYRNKGGNDSIKYAGDSDLARGFGVVTFLIPAFGILNVLNKYGISQVGAQAMLVLTVAVMMLALRYNWIDNAYKNSSRARGLFHAFLGATFPVLILFKKLNHSVPGDMVYLFWALLWLAMAFLIVVSIRREISARVLKNIKVAGLVMWPALCFGVFFLVINLMPLALGKVDFFIPFSTLLVFSGAIVFYVLFFSFLVFWGRSTQVEYGNKIRHVNVAGIFLVLSFLIAVNVDNKFHDVQLEKGEPAQLPMLEQYIHNWLADRERQRADTSTVVYPVFIVNAYGGGLRAAAWTSLMIAHLDSLVQKKRPKDDFQNHVIAYSGASGGTIGASVMCALRGQEKAVTEGDFVKFYSKDFLSPVIAGLVGRDFFASTFGVNLADRATLQDAVWEHHMQVVFQDHLYDAPFTEAWKNPYRTPLLFANTTLVEEGTKGVVAPVQIDSADFPATTPVMPLLKNGVVKFSTAAFFSARFPFISPAARVNSNHHFLDGGIYENSGAETALEIARVFQRVLARDTVWQQHFKLIIVSLKNSPGNAKVVASKNLFELSAPIKALLANVDGNATHADATNAGLFKDAYYQFQPKYVDLECEEKDTLNAILPLGWQLSAEALNRMHANIKSNDPKDLIVTTRNRLLKEF